MSFLCNRLGIAHALTMLRSAKHCHPREGCHVRKNSTLPSRRAILRSVAVTISATSTIKQTRANAAAYRDRIIVPFAPPRQTDIMARIRRSGRVQQKSAGLF
jgi:hypothetical protein